ncbi:retrovirus-related pol polyprotein from transposon TNT 1-94, partial [Tanacetum coccineum]
RTNRGNHVEMTGFVDSDYAKDPDKEAEYMALTKAMKEAIWLRQACKNGYNSYLSKIASGSNEKPKMVYPYRRVITGFAAKISNEQAKVMETWMEVFICKLEKPIIAYNSFTTVLGLAPK